MEKFQFLSNLLVPAPKLAGNDFRWIDTFYAKDEDGNTECINVLVFNTPDKNHIKPMLEHELKRLQLLKAPEEIDTHNMAFIESVIREMESGTHEHQAPGALLKALALSARQEFTDDEVIYLSGVTRIS